MKPDFDDYFLTIADAVARRGDCVSSRVGAVLVNAQQRILATGYNGVAPGEVGCLDHPCNRAFKLLPDKCPGYSDCRASHAEANAILYAGRDKAEGATLYLTRPPCDGCKKLISAAGVKRTVYRE